MCTYAKEPAFIVRVPQFKFLQRYIDQCCTMLTVFIFLHHSIITHQDTIILFTFQI